MKRYGVLAALFVLGSILSGCSEPENEPEQTGVAAIGSLERITVDNVRAILEESPGEFVIGVQEVLDDAACYKEWGETCLVRVRIVEYLGGETDRPMDRKTGWTYDTREAAMHEPWPNRALGRRRLIIGYPNKDEPRSYGNRLFIVDPTADTIKRLQEVIMNLEGRGFELSTAQQRLEG